MTCGLWYDIIRTHTISNLSFPIIQSGGGVITNITGITQRRVDMVFGIGYNDDIEKGQKILEEIVNGHERF